MSDPALKDMVWARIKAKQPLKEMTFIRGPKDFDFNPTETTHWVLWLKLYVQSVKLQDPIGGSLGDIDMPRFRTLEEILAGL